MSWTTAKLNDLASVSSGGGAPQDAEAFSAEGIPFVRAGSLVKLLNGHPEESLELLKPEVASSYKLKLFPAGTVLFAKSGMSATKGHVYQLKKPAFVVNHLAALTPNSKCDGDYLRHVLRFKSPTCLIKDEAYPSIRLGDIAEMEIPTPEEKGERDRIVAILDQADALRRLRQRALDCLKTLGQAIFHEMFGDPKANPKGLPWIELGDVADFYSGNTLPEGEPFSDQVDGHLILKVSDLNHPRNQQDVVCAASWSTSPGSRAATCPPDALVFPKRGGAIGTNKKRWLKRSAILDPNLMGVRPDGKQLTMSFLNGWFQTFNLSDIASGSSVPQLNKKDLAPLKVALPPVAEQLEYARRIEALSMVRNCALGAALHDEELFNVLQYRAFRGEL